MPKPDQRTYREASVRTFADWTPGLLRSAQILADGGSLRLAADLCETLLGDARVQAPLGTRVRGLLRLPLAFDGDGDRRRRTAVERAVEQDFWKAFPEDELAQLGTWGTLLGVGLGELVWTKTPGRVLPRLKVWHPRWLRFDWETRAWLLSVDGGSEVVVQAGDGKWVLYTPYGANRPWSLAPWRAVATAQLVKKFAIQDWARHSEAHGSPVKVGTVPEGADPKTRREVARDIAQLASDATITLPHGYDLKFVEATARTWETFQAEIAWANTEMAVALVGQNLTSEVQGGSFAAALVHQTVRRDLIEADAQSLSTCLREQALTWWAEFNFGSRELAPWPCWDTTPPADRKSTSEAQKTAAEAVSTLISAGVPVDVEAFAEQHGIPLRKGGPLPEPAPEPAPNAGRESAQRRPGVRAQAAREPVDEGQRYVDDLAAVARDAAAQAIAPDLQAVLDAIEKATSFDELQAELPRLYAAMDPTALAELLDGADVLAHLAGRRAVTRED